MTTRIYLLIVALLSCSLTFAAPAKVDLAKAAQKAFGQHLPEIKGVIDTPIPNIKGIALAGGQMLYVTADGKTFIAGTMLDATGRNLSAEQGKPFTRVDFSKLPLADAFKRVRGDGKRTLVTFEDPNCGYCKKLTKEIEKLDNVTVYTFLVGIISQDSPRLAMNIWCSEKPGESWVKWTTEGVEAPQKLCDSPVERNGLLMNSLGAGGTPFIVFKNGDTSPGYMPSEVINAKLNEQIEKP